MKNILRTITIMSLSLSFLASGNLMAQKVGDPAPDFSLQTTKGTTFTLSAHKGKVVFIFLFGNSCSHCLANGPNTESIYQTFKANPDFVAIGVDVWDGSASSVANFKNRTGITYQLALDGGSLTSSYSTTYDRILIVDKQGNLHYKATSNATSGVATIVTEQLEMLLKGTTGIDNSEVGSSNLSVYPNPVSDLATIQTGFEPGSELQVNLVEITGRVVLDQFIQSEYSGEIMLDVNDYPAGMYFLRLKSDDEVKSTRIIITD